MGDKTGISWCDATWNPVVGCDIVSPACTDCYAMKMAARLERMGSALYAGLTRQTKGGPVWTGETREALRHTLLQPLRWARSRRIFVVSMGDLFHASVSDETLDRIWAVMAMARQHTFLVLTKRTARMRAYLSAPDLAARWAAAGALLVPSVPPFAVAALPLPNVHVGCTVEDRARAAERLPDLGATPAAVRWVSHEPALEHVDFRRVDLGGGVHLDALTGFHGACREFEGGWPAVQENLARLPRLPPAVAPVDQIIMGGESVLPASRARPFDLAWAHDVLRQTRTVFRGTAFYFKQTGSRPVFEGVPAAGITGKGDRPAEWPEDLRVQELPEVVNA